MGGSLPGTAQRHRVLHEQQAAGHRQIRQRIRDRFPHLERLVGSAELHLAETKSRDNCK